MLLTTCARGSEFPRRKFNLRMMYILRSVNLFGELPDLAGPVSFL